MLTSDEVAEVSEPKRQSQKAWVDRVTRTKNENQAKVLKWLHDNPLSTADEIFKGCGAGVSAVRPRYLTIIGKGLGRPWKYRLNLVALADPERATKKFGRERSRFLD